MGIDRQTSLRLGAAGFLCSLMVVLIHCQSMGLWLQGDVSDFGLCRPGCAGVQIDAAVRFILSYTFVRLAVPFFFALTGFFLAMSEKGWVENVRKRFITLYIPFVLWNALNVGLNVVAGRLDGEGLYGLLEKVFGWNTTVRLGCMQFWYLQAVFVFLIAWPVLRPLFDRWWSAAMLIIVLFLGWVDFYSYDLGHAMQASNYLWMSCGAVTAVAWKGRWKLGTRMLAAFRRLSVRIAIAVVFAVSVIVKVWTGVVRNIELFDVADKVLIASGLAAMFLNLHVFDYVAKRCSAVIGLAFFVFAFHTIPITLAVQIGTRLGVYGFTLYIFKIVFATSASIGAGLLFRRCLPCLFNVMTGGRR